MNIYHKQSGISLINALVGVTIIVIAFLGIWNMFNFSLKIISDNRSRTLASAIANEKIEIIKNLPYSDVGTFGGTPPGAIPQTETINRNNSEFIVETRIFYVDDPYDNVAPNDSLINDYKKVKINIDWPGRTLGASTTSYILVSPKGVETDEGGGTIRVIVFNSFGEPIQGADVQFINNEVEPIINTDYTTGQGGIFLYSGAPVADESYEIVASKAGYSIEKTYPEVDGFGPPSKPHVSVIKSLISEVSFTIDVVGVINISVIGKDYPSNWKINTASTSAEQLLPDVCVNDNNNYYFAWQDDKDTGAFKIYAQKYNSDKIAQWAEDKRVSTANNQVNPRVATDGTNLSIAWNDDREGNQDCYLSKVDSAGIDLWGDKKISTLSQNKNQTYPCIAINKSTNDVFAVFQEDSGLNDSRDIYLQKYDSSGDLTAEMPEPLKINNDATDVDQIYPQIVFYNDILNDDQGVFMVWQDYRGGDWDIYAHKYNATGTALWANNLKLNTDTGTASQINPKIAVDNSANLYIVWADDRNTDWNIYAHKYDADGSAIWANEIKINTDSTTSDQTEPAIAVDSSSQIFISWTDERNFDTQDKDIYAQKLDTDGNNLWADDERIIFNDTNNIEQQESNIAVDNFGFAVFTWQDSRDQDTDTDIFSARYKEPGVIMNIPNAPLNVRGTKTIYNASEDPPILAVLKFDNNYTTDANGVLQLANVEWDSYTIEPQSTSTYTLISSGPPQPIILDPGQTINVELNVE